MLAIVLLLLGLVGAGLADNLGNVSNFALAVFCLREAAAPRGCCGGGAGIYGEFGYLCARRLAGARPSFPVKFII